MMEYCRYFQSLLMRSFACRNNFLPAIFKAKEMIAVKIPVTIASVAKPPKMTWMHNQISNKYCSTCDCGNNIFIIKPAMRKKRENQYPKPSKEACFKRFLKVPHGG